MLAEMQDAFRHAALTGDTAPAAAFVAGGDIAPAARVGVHLNTVQASLAGVLAAAYPALERLLGADNFRLLARRYVAAHPPRRPQLAAYGSDMPAFLAAFEHTARYLFLPDLARLEWARCQALFAGDAPILGARPLEGQPPEALASLVLPWHPATQLIESPYAVGRLWEAQALAPGIAAGAETALVTRTADGAVQHRLVSPGDAALLKAFADGLPLQRAAAHALAAEPDLDLQAALAGHLAGATFTLPHPATATPGSPS